MGIDYEDFEDSSNQTTSQKRDAKTWDEDLPSKLSPREQKAYIKKLKYKKRLKNKSKFKDY